jgi:hypothetical protein
VAVDHACVPAGQAFVVRADDGQMNALIIVGSIIAVLYLIHLLCVIVAAVLHGAHWSRRSGGQWTRLLAVGAVLVAVGVWDIATGKGYVATALVLVAAILLVDLRAARRALDAVRGDTLTDEEQHQQMVYLLRITAAFIAIVVLLLAEAGIPIADSVVQFVALAAVVLATAIREFVPPPPAAGQNLDAAPDVDVSKP